MQSWLLLFPGSRPLGRWSLDLPRLTKGRKIGTTFADYSTHRHWYVSLRPTRRSCPLALLSALSRLGSIHTRVT
jgi:hypothetical protein